MASFMGRRQAENWKSSFSGVWRAEPRREVTVDNELSQTVPCGTLAFRGAVTTAKGEVVRKGFVPSRNKEGFYHCRCDNKNNYHFNEYLLSVGLWARRLWPLYLVFMVIRRHFFLSHSEDEEYEAQKS